MPGDHHSTEQSFRNYLAQTSEHPYGIHVESAEGCHITDKNGKSYLDLISGIAVAVIGHRHPEVMKAIRTQGEKYLHTMVYGEYIQDIQVALAERLVSLLPDSLNCVYLVNSGTEANEAALKLVKRHTGRTRLVAFRGSYHGNTQGSMSVSGNEDRKRAFRPLLPDVDFLIFNDLRELGRIDERTAGVIIEPVQGDAGVRTGSAEFLQALRRRCDETGALLIYDEIQCGLGRTGKMFASEHSGTVPDMVTLAKGLGGGLPIGAMIAGRDVMRDLSHHPMLGHITTFGGNPLSCAASLAVLQVLMNGHLVEQAEKKGRLITGLLKHRTIKDVRQIGLMIAVDLENEEKLSRLIEDCKENGVIIYRFLSHPYSFRISPPLTITEEEIRKGISVILDCLARL